MKVSGTQRYQFPNSLVNWEKFGVTAQTNIQKPHYSITIISYKHCEVPLEQNQLSTF